MSWSKRKQLWINVQAPQEKPLMTMNKKNNAPLLNDDYKVSQLMFFLSCYMSQLCWWVFSALTEIIL